MESAEGNRAIPIDINARIVWSHSMLLFSLDLAQVFSEELRVTSFLSNHLREIARNQISELLPRNVERHENIEDKIPGFITTVRQELGDDLLESILSWQQIAFPGHTMEVCYWEWIMLLIRLSQAWEEEGLAEALPLTRSELAPVRIQIRDYLHHDNNMHWELEHIEEQITSKNTLNWEWDRRVLRRFKQWFHVSTSVFHIMKHLQARDLWDYLLSKLEEADLEILDKWVRSEAERDPVLIGYAEPPKL